MLRSKKIGAIEIGIGTLIMSLITFLGTGVYNMFKINKNIAQTSIEHTNIQLLQNKYCTIVNPTPLEQQLCIEALKLSITNMK